MACHPNKSSLYWRDLALNREQRYAVAHEALDSCITENAEGK